MEIKNQQRYGVVGALLLSYLETFGLDVGFCVIQTTVAHFLFYYNDCLFFLEKLENDHRYCGMLSKLGDYSNGIFYIHMAVI